jgi:hypothetical protein
MVSGAEISGGSDNAAAIFVTAGAALLTATAAGRLMTAASKLVLPIVG